MNTLLKKRLQEKLAAVQNQIEVAEAAVPEMTAGGISTFELDTGEADQKVIFRNIQTFQRYLDGLYAKEEWLMRRLTGSTVTSVRVRRKP